MTQKEMEALLEETEVNVRVAAAQVSRRYRGIVTYADLAQDGKVWVLQHPGTCTNRLEDGRRGSRRLTGLIAKRLDGIARREKAAGLYDPQDEAFYSRTMVEAVLPAVWDENVMLVPPEQAEGVRGSSSPSEHGSWLAMTMDIRRAWATATMESTWRLALAYRYGEGLRIYQIATLMEVADSTAHNYITKGIRALIKELGGENPGRCPPDCECGSNPVGKRKVISNAQANAQTERDYE